MGLPLYLDCSWYWKKICFIKEYFKDACTFSQWIWQDNKTYKVRLGYQWQLGDPPKVPWAKLVWARSLIPRHAFITWIYTHRRLPTKVRLDRVQQQDTLCSLCQSEEKDDQQLYFTCPYAQEVRQGLKEWWSFPTNLAGHSLTDSLITV